MTTIRSMTGHGTGEAHVGSARVRMEMRSVNHRHLDVRMHLSAELSAHAGRIEAAVREHMDRGRIDVTGRVHDSATELPTLDRARAKAAFEQLCELRDELRPDEPVPLSLLSSVPDLFVQSRPDAAEGFAAAVVEAAKAACDALTEMRAREGAALAKDLRSRSRDARALIAKIAERQGTQVQQYRERLGDNVRRITADTDIHVDEQRLAQEVVLLAERCDIAEELTRLGSHFDQFDHIMAGPGSSIGRRLDFLLQEMHREANTVGAKSYDGQIAHWVVDLRANVERMREQARNVL